MIVKSEQQSKFFFGQVIFLQASECEARENYFNLLTLFMVALFPP